MDETSILRKAVEIIVRETGYMDEADALRAVADRLDRPDPDEALAKAIYTAHAKHVGPFMPSWEKLSENSKDSSRASARAARAHIAAEPGAVTESAPEPWAPTLGRWAQIKPGADRGRIPASVERVLVLSDTDSDDEVRVGWAGDAMPDRTTWEYFPADSLAPVQPRVWDRAEDVPRHVVVRDRNGIIAPRSVVGDEVLPFVGPYREVLPEDGAL